MDRLISPGPHLAGEALRRARILVSLALTLVGTCTVALLPSLWRGHLDEALVLAVGASGYGVAILLVRRGHPTAAARVVCLSFLFILQSFFFLDEGARSSSLSWCSVIPLIAFFVAESRREALRWAAVSALTLVGWYIAAEQDLLPDHAALRAMSFESPSIMLGTLLAFGWAFDSARERLARKELAAVQNIHLVLDNVGQGLLLVAPDGALRDLRSSTAERWFGAPPSTMPIWDYLCGAGTMESAQLRLSWESLVEGVLPRELLLEQMPKRIYRAERVYGLEFRPIDRAGAGTECIQHITVMASDITDLLASQQMAERKRDYIEVLQRVFTDRSGFAQFMREARTLVQQIVPGGARLKLDLHTLKGLTATWGASGLSRLCHELEDSLGDSTTELTPESRYLLTSTFATFETRMSSFVRADEDVVLRGQELDRFIRDVKTGSSVEALLEQVSAWRLEPVATRLGRYAQQARELGRQLHKGELQVDIEADDTRLDPAKWAGFWAAMGHAICNAVDHGVESPQDREAAGKPVEGRLRLCAQHREGELLLSIEDDGRGIDWDEVRARAVAAGMPSRTQADLEGALYTPGFSTKDVPTETSGRGVGLAALRDACTSMGGHIRMSSIQGRGTTLTFLFPDPAHSPT